MGHAHLGRGDERPSEHKAEGPPCFAPLALVPRGWTQVPPPYTYPPGVGWIPVGRVGERGGGASEDCCRKLRAPTPLSLS